MSNAPTSQRRGPSYASQTFGSYKRAPIVFHWPALWALLLAATLQFALGLVPTMISFVLLVAADERRCPVAFGAARTLPFVAWLVGAGVGIAACEAMTTNKRHAAYDWVFWGSLAELSQWTSSGSPFAGR
jgi:hypothetical protein